MPLSSSSLSSLSHQLQSVCSLAPFYPPGRDTGSVRTVSGADCVDTLLCKEVRIKCRKIHWRLGVGCIR